MIGNCLGVWWVGGGVSCGDSKRGSNTNSDEMTQQHMRVVPEMRTISKAQAESMLIIKPRHLLD